MPHCGVSSQDCSAQGFFFSAMQRTTPSAETCWAGRLLLGKLPGRRDAGRGRAALAQVLQGCQQRAQHTFHAATTLSFAQHQTPLSLLAKWAVAATLATPVLAFNGVSRLLGYILGM